MLHTTSTDTQLFGSDGTFLRTIGQGLLNSPYGVCVDSRGRVYVASYNSESVVVMDQTGTQLAAIAVPGYPVGVLVTRAGKVVVSIYEGPSALVVMQ